LGFVPVGGSKTKIVRFKNEGSLEDTITLNYDFMDVKLEISP